MDKFDEDLGLHILEKTSEESLLFDFDLSTKIRTGDTIASFDTCVAYSKGLVSGSEDLVISDLSFSGTLAQAVISAGTAYERYWIEATVTTVAGDIVVGVSILNITPL